MSEKKQVLKNLSIQIVATASQILIGLWLTPYLVHHLGATAYGFVPIAAVLADYIVAITGSINAAVSRFLTINIQEENWVEGNKTFNTALLSNVTLIAVQLPVLIIVLFNLSRLFTIPDELLHDVFYLVLFSGSAFLINVVFSVFATSLFSHNRLDLMRGITIFNLFIRTAVIVLCFSVDAPRLYYVSFGTLVAAILSNLITYILARRLTPQLKIRLGFFDKKKLTAILGMSVWLLVSWGEVVLFNRSELMVANNFVGPAEAGKYAVAEQWRNVITGVIYVLAVLTTPLILAAYAKKNFEKLKYVVVMTMKFVGIFMSIICGILIVQSRNLLNVWVGPEFGEVSPLLIMLIAPLPVNLAAATLFRVFEAYNRVRTPAIISVVLGMVNVGLAILLAKFSSLGMYGIALSGMIMMTINDSVTKPIYVSMIMKEKVFVFVLPLLRSIFATALVVLVASPILLFTIDSWLDLIVSSAIAGIAIVPLIWKLVFSRNDRQFMVELFPQKIQDKLSRFAR